MGGRRGIVRYDRDDDLCSVSRVTTGKLCVALKTIGTSRMNSTLLLA